MTATSRLAALKLQHGTTLTSSKIEDDLTRALYWKTSRWGNEAICEYYDWNDERESVRVAVDARRAAAERHAAIIHMMWQRRRMLRLADACVSRTVALEALFSDTATSRAIERL